MTKSPAAYEKLLHSIAFSPKRSFHLFKFLPVNDQAFALLDLSERVGGRILSRLHDEEITSLLHYADLYQTTKILRSVPEDRRRKLIKGLNLGLTQKRKNLPLMM